MVAVFNSTHSTLSTNSRFIDASTIPPLSKNEAGMLARAELTRCIDILRQLQGDDWQQPTDCTEWNVRDMTAHLAGACAGHARWSEFRRQYLRNPYMRRGEDMIHGINRCQVADREGRSTDELIAEFQQVGPKAIQTRQNLPFFIRAIRAPMQPLGVVSVRYLMDTIYTRDQWMHRADISRATGKPIHLTPEHDGRIMDLVMADFDAKLRGKLTQTIHIHLTGPLELRYRFGPHQAAPEAAPEAVISIELVEFNRLASRRITPEEARKLTHIEGDEALGEWLLEHCEVGY